MERLTGVNLRQRTHKALGNLADKLPIIGKKREERREKEEHQKLLESAMVRAMLALRDGYVGESYNEGYYTERFDVFLRNSGGKLHITFRTDYQEEGETKNASLEIIDDKERGEGRLLHFRISSMDASVPFFSDKWTGAYGLNIDKKLEIENRLSPWAQLGKEEKETYLKGILNSQVDRESTEKWYKKAKEDESVNSIVYWVHDTGKIYPFLPRG